MKTRYTLLILTVAITALIFWWLFHQQPQRTDASASEPNTGSAILEASPQTIHAQTTNAEKILTPEEFAAGKEERLKKRAEAIEQSNNEWRAPINFFGKVIDESNNPVADANVHFIWTDLSLTGNSERATTSDGYGIFSLQNTTGKNLIVTVSKSDYYEYVPSGLAFNYAGENQNFIPDQNNPVIFRLKKKGEIEPLIHIQATMGGLKDFVIPKDGTPIEVSLSTGNKTPAGQGDVIVRCWTDSQGKLPGQKYDWKCEVSIPGGGLQPATNVFNFEAPTEGYQASEKIEMSATRDKTWGNSFKGKYFLKLRNGNYARMSFEMIAAGGHFFSIESFLNPSGSRNLESDSGK